MIETLSLSSTTVAKMGKGGDVSTEVLRKICKALGCKIEDIVEIDTFDELKAIDKSYVV